MQRCRGKSFCRASRRFQDRACLACRRAGRGRRRLQELGAVIPGQQRRRLVLQAHGRFRASPTGRSPAAATRAPSSVPAGRSRPRIWSAPTAAARAPPQPPPQPAPAAAPTPAAPTAPVGSIAGDLAGAPMPAADARRPSRCRQRRAAPAGPGRHRARHDRMRRRCGAPACPATSTSAPASRGDRKVVLTYLHRPLARHLHLRLRPAEGNRTRARRRRLRRKTAPKTRKPRSR